MAVQSSPTHDVAATELDDFLTGTIARQVEAETAIHNGDPQPRLAMWSTQDPVSLFGAWGPCKTGSDEVTRTSQRVAARFSDCTQYSFDVVAADVRGDIAYTVGFERATKSVDGGPPTSVTTRVTHVYRREDGEWKIVHRHGDPH